MSRSIPRLFGAFLPALALPLSAGCGASGVSDSHDETTDSTHQRVIYGQPNRKEVSTITDESIRRNANSVVAIFRATDVTPSDATTYLKTTPLSKTSFNMCPTEPLGSELSGAICSGVLVANNLVATAAHCVRSTPPVGLRFVFGFNKDGASKTPESVPTSEVYAGKEVVQMGYGDADWAIVRLATNVDVAKHQPVILRSSGEPVVGQKLYAIGHPFGLAGKIMDEAAVRPDGDALSFRANLDLASPGDGAPVFNTQTHQLEGLAVSGEADLEIPTEASGTQCRTEKKCSDTGCAGEKVLRTNQFAKYAVSEDWRRTVVFMYGQTSSGQDMFLRGGMDHDQAMARYGKDCKKDPSLCSIPIRHRNKLNATTNPWKVGDTVLDWYGAEVGQTQSSHGMLAFGTPADWSTNRWPADWGQKRTVAVDGYGEEPLNTWGHHYWMLDVDMDCARGIIDGNGVSWFELKSYISNGPSWEADVNQSGTPYPSRNHFGQCGKINAFRRGESWVEIRSFPAGSAFVE